MPAERAEAIDAFLAASGWGAARRAPLPGDASTRRYERLAMGGRAAMLMDQPQSAETPAAGARAGRIRAGRLECIGHESRHTGRWPGGVSGR